MAGSKKGTTKGKTASASTNKNKAEKGKVATAKTKMDETPDTTVIKDSSGDVIMETNDGKLDTTQSISEKHGEGTKSDTEAIVYDSDGNNLYEDEDQVSVSDKTTAASNESPDKGKSNKR